MGGQTGFELSVVSRRCLSEYIFKGTELAYSMRTFFLPERGLRAAIEGLASWSPISWGRPCFVVRTVHSTIYSGSSPVLGPIGCAPVCDSWGGLAG